MHQTVSVHHMMTHKHPSHRILNQQQGHHKLDLQYIRYLSHQLHVFKFSLSSSCIEAIWLCWASQPLSLEQLSMGHTWMDYCAKKAMDMAATITYQRQ